MSPRKRQDDPPEMSTESPERGFSAQVVSASVRDARLINKVLNRVREQLCIYSSTPNRMETCPVLDNDSGYVSHHQESNPDFDGSDRPANDTAAVDAFYLSEDALLENPETSKQETVEVYEEFSHLYYLNAVVDASVETTTRSQFSGFNDSNASSLSDISPVLNRVDPIRISLSTIESDAVVANKSNELERSADENDANAPNRAVKRKRSPSPTPTKRRRSVSPDLFSEDEQPTKREEPRKATTERFCRDSALVKRIKETLTGVPPPPCVPTSNMTVADMLEKIRSNGEYFWSDAEKTTTVKSVLVDSNLDDSCMKTGWPDGLELRYHGLHYNRSKKSEELERLCVRYLERYIGGETQSSCTVFDVRAGSPSKRRLSKLRWTAKSPGRRLSHLARRRITFSNAGLQSAAAASSSTGTSSSHVRQIVVDAKRYELLSRKSSPRKTRSPRKTPRKSPRKMSSRTPGSSSKKRFPFRVMAVCGEDLAVAGPSNSASKVTQTKRALFRSPEEKINLNKPRIVPSTSNPSSSPWKKRSTPKRALFLSPAKGGPLSSSSPGNKRKRTDNDDAVPSKIARSLSLQDKICTKATDTSKLKSFKSESMLNYRPAELSQHHKQKLQWAVYEALRGQNIGVSHPQFKQFAGILARVVRRLLPTLPPNGPRPEIGTSERMLRIAKQHIYSVIKGKTLEEIILAVDASRSKNLKPSGYISKEAAEKMDVSVARNAGVFQDRANIIMNETRSVEAAKTKSVPENKADRVRKVINFDR